MDIRIGNGYDVHALKEGLPMWLGGIKIDSEKGFVAHSDGDVAIHALCDALLGALALGDIGHLFPDNDPQWKGIDSKILLRKVVGIIHEKGYEITIPADIAPCVFVAGAKEEDGKLLYDTQAKAEVLGEKLSSWVEIKPTADGIELMAYRLVKE